MFTIAIDHAADELEHDVLHGLARCNLADRVDQFAVADHEWHRGEAVELGKPTDWLIFQGDALRDLAEVLATTGRVEEAAATYEQALDHYGRKKNLALAAQVQPDSTHFRAKSSPC